MWCRSFVHALAFALTLTLTLSLPGCVGEESSGGEDTHALDTVAADTVVTDTVVTDTGLAHDTGDGEDVEPQPDTNSSQDTFGEVDTEDDTLPTTCSTSDECGGDEVCSDGTCVDACGSDDDCPGGLACDLASGLCLPDDPAAANGEVCTADDQCASDHCQNGFCCTQGDCCVQASDCPDSYSTTSTCLDASADTTCQGEAGVAACADFVCQTLTDQPDDSGCAGLERQCGFYLSIACSDALEQEPAACPESCTGDGECVVGASCRDGECAPPDGVGEVCTGTGQGTCVSGLTCVNGTCCSTPCDGPCAECSTGACQMPADDDGCGAIDCDTLDTACRDYHDLTTNRCEAVGQCRAPNSAACTEWTDAAATERCGTACKFCDGSGGCDNVDDDTACGTIDCDGLNPSHACRDYNDIITNRCVAGACKPANDTTYCTSYSNASNTQKCATCKLCNGLGDCSSDAADDTACGTIACDGMNTACRDYIDLTSNRCVSGGCKPANSPTYCTQFTAHTNASCGTCKSCSSAGNCDVTPADDNQCDPIDCSGSDSTCRDYHDVTTNLCESFGICKTRTTYCTSYTNTPASPITQCGLCRACNGSGGCDTYCEAGDTCQDNMFGLDDCQFVTLNEHSESCENVCANRDAWCVSVGTDSAGTNELYFHWQPIPAPGVCLPNPAECNTWLAADFNVNCSGHEAQWTNCFCERN